jgi:Vacuolar sorting-associated protein 13, extended-chorein
MLGTWNGFMYRKVVPTLPCRGMLSMTLRPTSVKEQTLWFEGTSRSSLGGFRVSGRCSQDAAANSFHFTMKREFVSDHTTQYWDGQFDVATETIMGTWGIDRDASAHFGTFILKRTAPEDLRFRPAPATIEAKKARSLWTFAISAVLSRVRRQLWSWSHFKERKHTRERFITLYTRHVHLGHPLNGDELLTFRRVRRRLTAADSRFYHSLADDRIRKIINHG